MKYNFNQPFRDLNGDTVQTPVMKDGKPVVDTNGQPKYRPVSLLEITKSLLVTDLQDDDGPTKYKAFKLATKFEGTPDKVELDIEEAAFIKDRVGRTGVPLSVGRIWEVLDKSETRDAC